MPSTPRKRPASRSPDGARNSKRQLTSSPEEGEVDDTLPTPGPNPNPIIPAISLPAKPATLIKKSVPFPFKRKPDGPKSSADGEKSEPLNVFAQYEEAHRPREEPRRANNRPLPRSGKTDHWEPGFGRGESLLSRIEPLESYRRHELGSSRDSWDRERRRSPTTRNSPPRSRSPPSHYRGRHRLPAPRSPEASFSPPTQPTLDRLRDRSRERGYDRERDRDREWDRDRYRRDFREDDSRRFGRRNSLTDDSDGRYYRPQYNDHRRGDDREWTRRDPAPYRGREDDRYDRRSYDSRPPSRPRSPPSSGLISPPLAPPTQPEFHRPVSPPPKPPPPPPESNTPSLPPPPEDAAPRPPSSTPPPAPPPDERLLKGVQLPPIHASVKITMKRPDAPRNAHSPLPLDIPPNTARAMAQGPEKALEKPPPPPPQSRPSLPLLPPPHPPKEQKKEGESSRIQIMRRKLPMRRSEKEEVQVYGHGFMGCGQQSDYEATTKLGEGTFGEVHKAIHKKTGRAVALKRILMHNEKEGMPVTALREIKILKALKHPCIVDILDMFVVRSTDKDPLSVYMVFPYMDHDLAGLLENERVKLQPSHIKLYMKQLLEGTEYMHRNHILHRDMKAANLLISNNGSLRIADFGLARSFDTSVANARSDGTRTGRDRKYTNCVVTRWYRPPELLLGARHYGGEVDIWGIGCVLGEMFTRKPILPGTSDLDQLEKIWFLCGSPNQHNWPYHDQLPGCEGVIRFKSHTRRLKETYDSVGPETVDLLDQLLIINPKERITAAQALEHDYFWTDPLPADPKSLPSYEASHEFDKRGHRNHHPMPLPAGPPLQVQPVPHAHNQMRGGPPQGNPQFNRGPGGPPNQNQHQRHQYGNGPDMHRPGGPPGGQPGNYPAPNHPGPHNMGMNGPGPGRPPAVMGFGNGPGQGGPPPMGMPSMAGMPGMPPQFPPHPLPYGRSGGPPPGGVYGGVPPQPPLAVQFPLNPPRPPFPSHHQGNRPPMRNDRQWESRNNDPPPPPRTSSLPTNPNLPPRPAAPLGSGARDGERDRERDRVYRGAGRNDPPGPGEPPVGALNYG